MGYSEAEMLPAIKEFEKELGGLVRFTLNNFREGEALLFNQIQDDQRKESPNMVKFEKFLKSRGISNPYLDCSIPVSQSS